MKTWQEDIQLIDIESGQEVTARVTLAESTRPPYGPNRVKVPAVIVSAMLIYEEGEQIRDEACILPKASDDPQLWTGEESGRKLESARPVPYGFAVQ